MESQGHEARILAGGSGQFDVVADGVLVFSKREHGRFPEDGEISGLLDGAGRRDG